MVPQLSGVRYLAKPAAPVTEGAQLFLRGLRGLRGDARHHHPGGLDMPAGQKVAGAAPVAQLQLVWQRCTGLQPGLERALRLVLRPVVMWAGSLTA